MAEVLADHAAGEADGQEDGDDGAGDGDDGKADGVGGVYGGLVGPFAEHEVFVDVFDFDDGVVHQDADDEGQAEQGDAV